MAECSGPETLIRAIDFETGYTNGGFAGINMTAHSTIGVGGNWGARSNGTASQIESSYLGGAFGLPFGFTSNRFGIIEFDLLPFVPYPNLGSVDLIQILNGLVYVAALRHRTGASGASFGFDSVWDLALSDSAPNVNPQTAVYRHIEFSYGTSTLSLSGSVWVPNPDGFIAVEVDGVAVYNLTGLTLSGQVNWPTNANTWGSFLRIHPAGTIDNIRHVECPALATPDPLPPPNPTPCNCTPGTPGDPPDDEIPPDPGPIIPPLLAACAGGGVVPTAADYVSPETWWGL